MKPITPTMRDLLDMLAGGRTLVEHHSRAWIAHGPNVRITTVDALHQRGLIVSSGGQPRTWLITEAGREAIT